MLVASFPMYAIPEIWGAQSAFWKGLAAHFRRQGLQDVPEDLVFDQPLAALLGDESMLLSQCCGYDVVKDFTGILVPVGTPNFAVPGCLGAEYSSLIVVAEACPYDDILDMRGCRAAANGPASHSGMNALRHLVAPKHNAGTFFSGVRYSGSHLDSLGLIRQGLADVAAIDCVTHALVSRYRPAAIAGTRILGRTFHAPAPPFVTRATHGAAFAERLRAGLQAAFADPDLVSARQDLFLAGVSDVSEGYLKVLDFEIYAAKIGYAELR